MPRLARQSNRPFLLTAGTVALLLWAAAGCERPGYKHPERSAFPNPTHTRPASEVFDHTERLPPPNPHTVWV